MAADTLQLKHAQQLTRERPNTNEAGAETTPPWASNSTLSKQKQQLHNISKQKKKKPAAQDYLSAESFEYFNPLSFSDSDIDDAFADPWMVRELRAEATATTPSAAQADLSGIKNPPNQHDPTARRLQHLDRPLCTHLQ